MRFNNHWKRSIRKDVRAVSPAVSMVIITAATIVMVLVSSTYAYSALQRQQAASEFNAIQKSFQTFDDAVRDVGWNRASARSTHFTANFGFLEMVGNNKLFVSANVGEIDVPFEPIQTAFIRYNLSTSYLSFTDGYQNYMVGDSKTVIKSTTQQAGQAVIVQQGSWLNINLAYRVQVSTENSTGCTYVNVMVTKLDGSLVSYAGDFDLLARNTGVSTTTYPQNSISLDAPTPLSIKVTLEDGQGQAINVPYIINPDSFNEVLGQGKVVFNFMVVTVKVGGQ